MGWSKREKELRTVTNEMKKKWMKEKWIKAFMEKRLVWLYLKHCK